MTVALSSMPRAGVTGAGSQRIAVIGNPHARNGRLAALWRTAVERLRADAECCEALETRGDGADADRVAALIAAQRPDVVVAAGGDGTVREVVQGLMQGDVSATPALAIWPLGTANNFARALRLPSLRRDSGGIDDALAAIRRGARRRVDLGRVGDHYFVSSFALGMDADILILRNRLRAALRLVRGGYPLYMVSYTLNMFRPHGSPGRVGLDGAVVHAHLYNLLVTNTPIHGGEFRFDADNAADDGRLDVHLITGVRDYMRRVPAAFMRHQRYERGYPVSPPPVIERVRELTIEAARPGTCQIDGEEHPLPASFRISAVPHAVAVCVPG